jgi:hypothetical protein
MLIAVTENCCSIRNLPNYRLEKQLIGSEPQTRKRWSACHNLGIIGTHARAVKTSEEPVMGERSVAGIVLGEALFSTDVLKKWFKYEFCGFLDRCGLTVG